MTSIHAAEPVTRLIEELGKLPGIGPKSAQRLTYFLLRAPAEQSAGLADAIRHLKATIILCSSCQNLSDTEPCALCRDTSRDRSIICVVEEPLDLVAVERTRGYRGLYHVLHGVVSPMEGIGPDQIKVHELLLRLRAGGVAEVIMAMNLNLEGEATAMYLRGVIAPLGIRVTRLARGLPVGADLEYADEVTLARALEGRTEQ